MRFLALLGTLLAGLNAGAETPGNELRAELEAKRQALSSLHQGSNSSGLSRPRAATSR